MMRTGAQFYTLRDFCKTLDDFACSLQRVADIGYTTVQISGTCAYEADWLAEQLKKTGLKCVITHYPGDKIMNETEKTIEFHKTFDCRHIGIGSIPWDMDDDKYNKFVNDYKKAAKIIADNDCLFMVHNHAHEFKRASDGVQFIEKLSKDFGANELGFTFDTYWARYAGEDPADWIKKLSGRVPCVHFKDIVDADGAKKMDTVGAGELDFERIAKACEDAGTQYILVEQDDCNGEDPFVCIERSYKYLKSIGLE